MGKRCIYARGEVTVTCWVKDHARATGSTTIGPADRKTLVLTCAPAAWPVYEFDLTDAYGRDPEGPITASCRGALLGTVALGRNRIAVPREIDPGGWSIDFGARGLGDARLTLRPGDDLSRVGRLDFGAFELMLRLIDDRTGNELRGDEIEATIGVVKGRYVDERFHFALVPPDAQEVKVRARLTGGGMAVGPERRVPLDLPAGRPGARRVGHTVRIPSPEPAR